MLTQDAFPKLILQNLRFIYQIVQKNYPEGIIYVANIAI